MTISKPCSRASRIARRGTKFACTLPTVPILYKSHSRSRASLCSPFQTISTVRKPVSGVLLRSAPTSALPLSSAVNPRPFRPQTVSGRSSADSTGRSVDLRSASMLVDESDSAVQENQPTLTSQGTEEGPGDEQQDGRTCRICFCDGDDEDGRLIAPCRCSGTVSPVTSGPASYVRCFCRSARSDYICSCRLATSIKGASAAGGKPTGRIAFTRALSAGKSTGSDLQARPSSSTIVVSSTICRPAHCGKDTAR